MTDRSKDRGYPDERQVYKKPLSYQIKRTLWLLAYYTLFKCSLRPMYAWRNWLLRMYGAKIGRGVGVQRSTRIEFPWNLDLGDHTSVGEDVWLYSLGKIQTGEFTMISPRVILCTGTHDYTSPEMTLVIKPITVGRGVWLGLDAFVAPGVTIGENAVIGARSVVVKDMPAAMVCVGHPCKPLKPRL